MSDQPNFELAEPDRSLGELIGRLTTDLGDLVTAHIDLATTEIKAEVAIAGKGAGMLGGGAVAGVVAALLLSMAAAWGLAELMAPGLAFLIVGVLWAAAAVVLALAGRSQVQKVDPVPQQTMNELEEDQQWLKQQTN